MNIRLDIEYDGELFHGWQRQVTGHPTVQATIEDAVSAIAGQRTVIYGAGRTDSGVHAKGQVANFWAETPLPAEKWCLALNTRLPPQIRILKSQQMPLKFHAQKSAKSKLYEYRIMNRGFSSALDRRVYFWPHPLRWDKMAESLSYFVGEKDFIAFQSGKCLVRSTVRRVTRFELIHEPGGQDVYRFEIEGNGFLRQMVRNIVGTVMEVGQNLREPHEIEGIFVSKGREFAGRAAPARGLSLVKVDYGLDGPRD